MAIRSEITTHARTGTLHAHRHKGAYVALVLDGGYDELSADGAWSFEPGDVVIHPPYHFHANSFNGTTSVLNLFIPDAGAVSEEFQAYSAVRPACHDQVLKAGGDLRALREALGKADELPRQEPLDWVDSMARDLVAETRVRIAELARRYSVTKEHASRRFRQRYLMAPSTFRQERRFREALDLMRLTRLSLGQIAQVAGYSDQPDFCRDCVKLTGHSPGRLRRRYS